jgi:hypothetical protein
MTSRDREVAGSSPAAGILIIGVVLMRYAILMILTVSILIIGCEGGMNYCGDGICSEGEECEADCEVQQTPPAEIIVNDTETNISTEPEMTENETVEEEFVIKAEPANYELDDFPDMFSSNTVIAVGNEAPASDVVSATYIVNSLNGNVKSVLASEISSITSQNIISIGNACNNKITAEIIGNPANCMAGLEDGVGRAALYKNGNKIALVIDGYSNNDVRRTAKLLEEAPYKLSGSISCVYGSALDAEKITDCEE